jgi:thymidylate synthase ThyX
MTANVEQFEYFIFLRDSKYADPSIQILAQKIREAIAGSTPEELSRGEWHLPFVSKEEKQLKDATSISVARCARISYDNFNGYRSTLEQDVELANKLQVSQHWSCFEHQATPIFSLDQITHCDIKGRRFSGNFQNWQQYRQLVTQWNRY